MDYTLKQGFEGFDVASWNNGLPAMWILVLVALALWAIFWKGLALWHAARRGQSRWFVVMLFLNTAGILEIIYLFAVAKRTASNLFSRDA